MNESSLENKFDFYKTNNNIVFYGETVSSIQTVTMMLKKKKKNKTWLFNMLIWS